MIIKGLNRDRVRAVMLEECPEGFDARYPGRTKAKIPRVALTSIGPFHEVCGDGHEKLGAQALKLGNDVGISIYTYKDKFSDVVLKASVVRHCRSPAAIGHLYLDFIEEYGGEQSCFHAILISECLPQPFPYKQHSIREVRWEFNMPYR